MKELEMSYEEQTSHSVAFVCHHVFRGQHPVLLVSREGGDWQFLCGGYHAEEDRPHVVGLSHLLERDPTLAEVSDLPKDWEAERAKVGAAWTRSEISDR